MEDMTKDIVVSVIMTGRDDDYGNLADKGIRNLSFTPVPYIGRLANTIEKFDDGFKRIGVRAEIVIVDCAPTKFLFENAIIAKVCHQRNIRFIIVTRSMVRRMRLNPNGFDEFFAKNVGIRGAIGEYVLLTNSDAWPDQSLFDSISTFLKSNLSSYYGRPHSRIDLDQTNQPIGEGLTFHNRNLDGILGTPAAGDFVLTKTTNVLQVGGYNESGKRKFTRTRQAGLDGQLLMNLYIQGVLPKKLKGSIVTYDHNKILRHDYGVPQKSYVNNANWGLWDKPRDYIRPNVISVNHRDLKQLIASRTRVVLKKISTAKIMVKFLLKSLARPHRNQES